MYHLPKYSYQLYQAICSPNEDSRDIAEHKV